MYGQAQGKALINAEDLRSRTGAANRRLNKLIESIEDFLDTDLSEDSERKILTLLKNLNSIARLFEEALHPAQIREDYIKSADEKLSTIISSLQDKQGKTSELICTELIAVVNFLKPPDLSELRVPKKIDRNTEKPDNEKKEPTPVKKVSAKAASNAIDYLSQTRNPSFHFLTLQIFSVLEKYSANFHEEGKGEENIGFPICILNSSIGNFILKEEFFNSAPNELKKLKLQASRDRLNRNSILLVPNINDSLSHLIKASLITKTAATPNKELLNKLGFSFTASRPTLTFYALSDLGRKVIKDTPDKYRIQIFDDTTLEELLGI